MMEGSESGALVPSGTIMEVETWVKFSKIPVEFLTADALGMMASSIGSPVQMDEATFEKLEDAKWPPPLRRNKSKKTSANILIKIHVTAPLPPSVVVICPKGRKFTIQIVSEPTPKICLNCFCDGHFDFECCGTKVATVEVTEDDAVDIEDFVGGDLQLGVCFDSMNDEVDGEQGSVTTDGVESYEDPSVIVDVQLPTATCGIGDGLGGELQAAPAILDGFFEQSLVERTAAVLEVQSLLPASIAADGSEGLVISNGLVCYVDPSVVEAVLEVSPPCLPPAKAGDLEAVQIFSDRFDVEPLMGKEISADLPASVGDSSTADLQQLVAEPCSDPCIVDEQLSGVFHKWRDFTDDQWLLENGSATGVGLLGVEMHLLGVEMQDVDCLRGIGAFVDGVHGAVTIDRAEFHVFSPVVEADLAENFLIFEQLYSVVNSPRKHHKWRDKSAVLGLWCDTLDEQGMFSFDIWDLLQMLSRLVWNLAASYYEQVWFKIHH